MLPEEHKEANRRGDKLDLNTPEGRAEDKRLLTENVRRPDALLAARGDTLSDSTRELVLNLGRMTRELIDIGDAMPFVPEAVPEELPPPLDEDRINRTLEESDQDLAKSCEELKKHHDSIGDKGPTEL